MSKAYIFSPAVKEVRFHLCRQSPASDGLRKFLQLSYPTMKKHNPDIHILIREAAGSPARVIARFGYGEERASILNNMDEQECRKATEQLLQHSK